ncbi:hypothetical protein ACS127_10550 [Amphibacillus sp. Q70]|uniref:hypothetical protein n=1 Tax=Amphibacillus sp. Q70 TaxID=3453416 RepID=UPI003F85C848
MKMLNALSIICLLFIVVSCSDQNEDLDKDPVEPLENSLSEKDEALTFEDYQSLVGKLEEELEIPNYQLQASTFDYSIIIIDEELSFGKRQYITLDGTQESPINATQESLLFLHEQGDSLITITLAYTDNYIGNDILYYNAIDGFAGIEEELTEHVDLLSISYKNIVISFLQTKTDNVDIEDTTNAAKSLVSFLEKYND